MMGRRAHKYQRQPSAQIYKNEARRERELLREKPRPLELVNKVNYANLTPQPDEKVNEVNFEPEHCDLCGEPIEARLNLETDTEQFREMALCFRHLNHVRMYLGAERFDAEESEVA